MALHFELAGSQIDGARDYQEDAFLITNLTDANGNPSALIVVADGMGGHAAGNVASNMAVQAFNKHISENYPTENIPEILEQAVVKANDSIKATVAETPALKGMGCTMVAAIMEAGKICWASVGDSHLYLIRNRELTKKNADHSYGGFLDRMAAEGTPVEPEAGLSRNMLMSAIMGEDINEIDVPDAFFELQAGDKILVCSDGLDTLSAGKIIQFSDWSDSPKECADALMEAVKEADMPRQDNTTAVVVNVIEVNETVTTPTETPTESPAESPAEIGETTDEIPIVETPITDQAPDTEGESKSKTGLILSIAAAVVIVIAVAGFFVFGGKKQDTTPSLDTTVAEVEADADEVVEEILPTEEQEAEEEQPEPIEKVEVETIADPEVEPKSAKPSETAAPAPTATVDVSKPFQDTLKLGGHGPMMVAIPAGSFDMGSSGSSRYTDERPRHKVNAKKFAVSQYEITFAQYDVYANASGRKLPDSLYMDRETSPVIFISWDDAYYYVKWLTEQTGKIYRLPSEAEWEYMASGGKKSSFWWGFDEEPKRAHCFGCGTGLDPRKPTKIGSFEPNQFGVYDTAGNVAEWVHDCWHENYKGAPSTTEVWEGGDCAYRVVRGGSYSSPPQSLRTAKRDKFKSDSAYDHIGIRVVRELD
jgi:formylglycine-generating enzyme required for sulfatase activity/serine/threonine protein phosphatase PrpC